MKPKIKIELCPFSDQPLLCGKPDCGDCEIRAKVAARENQQVGENMKSYWISLNGAD